MEGGRCTSLCMRGLARMKANKEEEKEEENT